MEGIAISFVILFGGTYGVGTLLLGRTGSDEYN